MSYLLDRCAAAEGARDRAEAQLAQALDLLQRIADAEGDDLGTCPYFARWKNFEGHDPEAICAFGCVDEPQCVTCEPNGGWLSVQADSARAFLASGES